MLAHRYEIWDWGDPLSKPGDSIEKYRIGIVTLAKRRINSNYEVFNELVCCHIGRLIGLPIPPGVLVNDAEGRPWFASLAFAILGTELPDADIDLALKEQPEICCGMTVFDAWIANTDRHSRNFWYDYEDKEMWLFDHGHALLGDIGRKQLEQHKNDIAIDQFNNDLVLQISSFDSFDYWYELILSIPNEVIGSTIRQAATCGISTEDANACHDWLLDRRERLLSLFKTSKHRFPKYKPGLIDPFRDIPDEPDFCI